jgi:hypothetical protein
MRAAFHNYLAHAWIADRYRQAQPDGPAGLGPPFPPVPARPSRPRAPGRGGAPPAHRADIPSGRGATLVRAIQADGYLGAAKLSQPGGIGRVSADATNGRRNLR